MDAASNAAAPKTNRAISFVLLRGDPNFASDINFSCRGLLHGCCSPKRRRGRREEDWLVVAKGCECRIRSVRNRTHYSRGRDFLCSLDGIKAKKVTHRLDWDIAHGQKSKLGAILDRGTCDPGLNQSKRSGKPG